ncbi:MAG: response regulator [Bacillota bacterium]
MTGIELLQALSKQPDSTKAREVLFTGYGDEETAHAARKSGAYGYMFKPIDVEQLAGIVEGVESSGF